MPAHFTGDDAGSTGSQAARVLTIGHSTRSLDEVVAMLTANGATALVDVRSYPSSRRLPQWNQEHIQSSLPPHLEYRWIRNLGGRRHTPAGTATPNAGWRVKGFRDYADYMATEDFRSGLRELLALVHERRLVPAIMCSEAVPWRCHRRLISDALIVAGVEVHNIMSPTSTKRAELTNFAQVTGTTITYPPPGNKLPTTKPKK